MWICTNCRERSEDNFDSCWKCSTPRGTSTGEGAAGHAPVWTMRYEMFRGTLTSWEDLFQRAADFATSLGPERVAGISHSSDSGDGVVTVWYWAESATVAEAK